MVLQRENEASWWDPAMWQTVSFDVLASMHRKGICYFFLLLVSLLFFFPF